MIELGESKGDILVYLLNARMQHTRWMKEIKEQSDPHVESDYTRCDFGQWLISAEKYLGLLVAFKALHKPHLKLHESYKNYLNDKQNEALKQQIFDYSDELIQGIDTLEQTIQKEIA